MEGFKGRQEGGQLGDEEEGMGETDSSAEIPLGKRKHKSEYAFFATPVSGKILMMPEKHHVPCHIAKAVGRKHYRLHLCDGVLLSMCYTASELTPLDSEHHISLDG